MASSPSPSPGVVRSVRQWWAEVALREGRLAAGRQLLSALWEFLRESTPQRRRLRYGDAEYDWENRVNTTSAAVGWRERLLGTFHSPYQPTEPALFHEMIADLRALISIDFHEFVFVDLGSGKGRTLLMAGNYPFKRIVGVELLPALNQIAEENLAKYRGASQKCFTIESVCADAGEFVFPDEPMVIYLFNPFPETGLRRVLGNLTRSLLQRPRAVYVLYHNPLLEHVLGENGAFNKIGGTHQYRVYAARI